MLSGPFTHLFDRAPPQESGVTQLAAFTREGLGSEKKERTEKQSAKSSDRFKKGLA